MATTRPTSTRDAFAAAVECFLATSAGIDDGCWELPASERWSVGQLFAHVVRGMAVMSDYLDADTTPPDVVLPGAAAYFRSALDMDGVHDGIADRAVAAAEAAGPDRLAWAREVADAAVRRAGATEDDRILVHFAGGMRFVDYLETRITEVVVHTLDLQIACGLEIGAPADALAITNGVLLALVDRADPVGLAMALSGRSGHLVANVLG